MPQRHRYATPAELVEILAVKCHEAYMLGKRATGTESRRSESSEEFMVPFEQLTEASKDISRAAAAAMLDGLAEHGVPVGSLVKILVDEDTGQPVESAPVNLQERPEDAAFRFAGDLQYAGELLAESNILMGEMDRASGHAFSQNLLNKIRTYLVKAGRFPHRLEGGLR